MKVKLVKVGGSLAIVFPQEMLDKLGVSKDETLNAVDVPEGVLILNSRSELSKDLNLAEKIMNEDRNVLDDLSDS